MITSALQQRSLTSNFIYLLLGVVLLAGFSLRTYHINFDSGLNAHPDERSTTCFYAPSIGWPSSFDEFRAPQRSPLNPLWDRDNNRRRSFTYGHFPLYMGILTGELLSGLAGPASALPLPDRTIALMQRANTPCEGVAFAGRLFIALLDTWTIFLLFLLGRRVYGAAAGLLAAALYAFTAQAVQLSHFFTMDPASTTFVVLAVYGGALMVHERSWRGVIYAGVGAGLAIASKFSALPVLAVPVVAAFISMWRNAHQRGEEGAEPGSGFLISSLLFSLLLAFAAFFVTSPYAVLDRVNFIQATLIEQGRMVRGVADLPFTRQYRNTVPYLYFVQQQVVWGMGLPLGLIALAGSAWALAKAALLRAKPGELVAWIWVVPYFGITGGFLAKFNRYMSPILPFVLLFAAGLIVWLWRLGVNRQWKLAARLPAALLAFVAVGGGLFWSLAFVNGVYAREHTWVTASRWVYANAPAGSVILWELWDDPLPKSIPGEPGMDMGSHGLRHIDWSPYEEDTPEKYEILREKLREADYVIYSSKRIYESVDELPDRYPMTNRYYELMFGERLGFLHAADITSPPRLLAWTFPDHDADESWSLYDHPRVSIFAKQRQLNDAQFASLLGGSWENAIPWYRGKEPPLSPLLNVLGLGSSPESHDRGLFNIVLAFVQGQERPPPADAPADGSPQLSLMLERPLRELPLVDNYRWNIAASANPWLAVIWWWFVVSLLGWIAWPLAFALFRGLRDRGFLLAKTLGWLLCGWLLWIFASSGLAHNTVRNAWLVVALAVLPSATVLALSWGEIRSFLRRMWAILLVGEGIFAAAFLLFVLIRRANPDLWQPWVGGEKFMEFAFLNGILRSPSFPPVDPHFAGGYINYYYYGIYLVGYLVKLTGIYAEVAFNLAIPTLFALTVLNAFAVSYSVGGVRLPAARMRRAPGTAASPRWRPRPMIGPEHIGAAAETEQPPTAAYGDRSEDLPEQTEVRGPQPADAPDTAGETPTPPNTGALASNWETQIAADMPDPETDPPPPPAEPQPADAPDRPYSAGETPTPPNTGALTSNWETQIAADMPDPETDPPPPPDEPIPSSGSAPAAYRPWREGIGAALLAPLFVAILGNLAGFGELANTLSRASQSRFESSVPGLQQAVRAASGFWQAVTTDMALPSYDFWGPSRVIPHTINEFPFWSFLYADLHPHTINIPFSLFFLALLLTLLNSSALDWRRHRLYGALLLVGFTFTLGALAVVNLWELPTYFGLTILTLAVTLYRGRGRLHAAPIIGLGALQLVGAYLFFLPFFRNYTNVAASGIGLVRAPDELGQWWQIWGFLAFVLFSWLLVGREEKRRVRFLRLHRLLASQHTAASFTGAVLLPLLSLASILLLIFTDQIALVICLPALGIALSLLWQRGRAADIGAVYVALLTTTGLAILAGTQVIYLRDFLGGGDYYRMNTLFKFFIQVWVLWGIAAALALPRIVSRFSGAQTDRLHGLEGDESAAQEGPADPSAQRSLPLVGRIGDIAAALALPRIVSRFSGAQTDRLHGLEGGENAGQAGPADPNAKRSLTLVGRIWGIAFLLLLFASLAYPLWGTPARLSHRFPGWQPPIGTLNGMAFMENGVYYWPDGDNAIELKYDWEAIHWLLANVRGNVVVAESVEVDYYRAGGTRVASFTGLSGLLGKHEGEQRYGLDVGERHGKMSEFWKTEDMEQLQQFIQELEIGLIYVGQLERHQHPDALDRLRRLEASGLLETVYQNPKVTIYAAPSQVELPLGGQ